jgi:hypothetical protein
MKVGVGRDNWYRTSIIAMVRHANGNSYLSTAGILLHLMRKITAMSTALFEHWCKSRKCGQICALRRALTTTRRPRRLPIRT